jgi:hypothetical protein
LEISGDALQGRLESRYASDEPGLLNYTLLTCADSAACMSAT